MQSYNETSFRIYKKFLRMIRRTLFLLPGLGWLFVVSFLLTLPGSAFPTEDWFSKVQFDKWVHAGLFAVLVVCWCWGLMRLQKKKEKWGQLFIGITILATLYGVGMEFFQKYCVPNRSFDFWDIVADAVGTYAGYLFSRKYFIKK